MAGIAFSPRWLLPESDREEPVGFVAREVSSRVYLLISVREFEKHCCLGEQLILLCSHQLCRADDTGWKESLERKRQATVSLKNNIKTQRLQCR